MAHPVRWQTFMHGVDVGYSRGYADGVAAGAVGRPLALVRWPPCETWRQLHERGRLARAAEQARQRVKEARRSGAAPHSQEAMVEAARRSWEGRT